MRLVEGEIYSFADLKNEYGKDRSYAFIENDCVKAFILQPEMNPDFEQEGPTTARILVAEGPLRKSVAKKLTANREYPVFLKESTNKWRFVGMYTYSYYSEDPQDFKGLAKAAKRRLKDIAQMIVLNKKSVSDVKAIILKRAA